MYPLFQSCLQSYSSSLVSDPNHSGPLKCPCCPRLLRVEDAKVALDKELALHDLEKWDNIKRDELLRSMPSFRPCPHCGGGNGVSAGGSLQGHDNMENNTLSKKGGGVSSPNIYWMNSITSVLYSFS